MKLARIAVAHGTTVVAGMTWALSLGMAFLV
jgi:hypothetical protein